MNDLTASIGLAQLKKIKLFNAKRNKILKIYLDGIKKLKNIKPTFPYDLKKGSYWLFSIRTKYRDKLINFLKQKKISTAVHFVPLPYNSLYKKYYNGGLNNTAKVWKEIISLPFYPDLEEKKIKYIINCLTDFDRNI